MRTTITPVSKSFGWIARIRTQDLWIAFIFVEILVKNILIGAKPNFSNHFFHLIQLRLNRKTLNSNFETINLNKIFFLFFKNFISLKNFIYSLLKPWVLIFNHLRWRPILIKEMKLKMLFPFYFSFEIQNNIHTI